MQLLNKLLMDPNFAYGCLNNFAYCRSMYAIAADGDDPGNAEKVMRLVLEKGIRFNCINSSQWEIKLIIINNEWYLLYFCAENWFSK